MQIIFLSLTDAFVGFLVGWLLFRNYVPLHLLLVTMFAAQSFDWLEAPYKIFNWNFPPFSTVKKFQHHVHCKLDWPWGFLPQLGIVIFAVWLSLNLS